jgi:hypothetical protein
MMKAHSFDFGYYCNVPDLIWKKPATYATETPQHFMDLEIFDRAFAKLNLTSDPFSLSRAEFDKAYPQIPQSAGRSYWRVRELMDSLGDSATRLCTMDVASPGAPAASANGAATPNATPAAAESRAALQERWLITAGAVGHYVGDLAQPLHVTEDYDGQLDHGQKGIHSWFEDKAVDELSSASHPGRLEAEVGELAVKKWKAAKLSKLSVLELLKQEASSSNKELASLMKIDKRIGRRDIKKAAAAFEPMIRERLAIGAVYLAELWSRELHCHGSPWKYEGEKFYNFSGTPEYIAPGPVAPAPAPGVTAPSAPKADPTPKP